MRHKKIPVEHKEVHSKPDDFQTFLQWHSPEHIVYEKGKYWYMGMSVFGLLLLSFMIYDRAYTFILAMVTAVVCYYLLIYRTPPKYLHVKLGEDGIKIDRLHLRFEQMQCYWIVVKPDYKALHIRTKKHFLPDIVVYLHDADVKEISEFMKDKAKEIKRGEGFTGNLARILKI